MGKLMRIVIIGCMLSSCNSNHLDSRLESSVDRGFISQIKDGKYTTDFATAQELKMMRNTIDNFTLLNKKKFENLRAYQEFGDLLQMHTDRVIESCNLDAGSKNILCKKLDKIKSEVQTLRGTDIEKSEIALKNVNAYLAEIDSLFNYIN